MTKILNQIIGLALFALGAVKLIYTFLLCANTLTDMKSLATGAVSVEMYYPDVFSMISTAEFVFVILLLIMLVVNMNKHRNVIPAYLIGIFSLIVGFVIPKSMLYAIVFVQCLLYMEAGIKINHTNKTKTRKELKKSNWFYDK